MTTFLPNPLSSIFLSFGKRRQAWPRSSKCHRLTCYSFVRSSFVWKSFRKRSATLQSFPVDTIQADQIANTSFAQCESNNKSNNTHHFSIQSFIEIPSYHPWEPGSSHTELTSLETTDIYIPATPPLQIALFPHSILWTYTHTWSECYDSVSLSWPTRLGTVASVTWCASWRASLPHQWKRGRKLVAGGAPSGREVHVTIVTHSSTQAHIHTKKQSIVHSFNPFFTHTVIISPEVSSRRIWRSEKRLAATQHCQEYEHMVNQPHVLQHFNMCIIHFNSV